MVANWLYGVAYRTALKARSLAARRKKRERQVVEMPEPAVEEQDVWRDLQPLLDQELSRLPDKYRVPIVLCDLGGKTRKEAAQQLGWPEGTVAGRLATARQMLAKRLAQRGVVLSGGALAAVLWQNVASAGGPASVAASTIRAANLFAAGQAAGVISVKVAALTEGVLKSMLLTKLKIATAMLLVLAVAVAGVGASGLLHRTQAGEPAPKEADKPKQERQEDAKPAKAQGQLPKGPMPVQALVSLDNKGQLVVRTIDPENVAVQKNGVTTFETVETPMKRYYKLENVQVQDTKGKEIDKEGLPKLVKGEIAALVTKGGRPVDPLHLQLCKEGTLLFLLPPPERAEADKAEPAKGGEGK
jgi:hypothetical protein